MHCLANFPFSLSLGSRGDPLMCQVEDFWVLAGVVSWGSNCIQWAWNIHKHPFPQVLDWEVCHLACWVFCYPQSGPLWAPPYCASASDFPGATLTGWGQYALGKVAIENEKRKFQSWDSEDRFWRVSKTDAVLLSHKPNLLVAFPPYKSV